MYISTPPSPEVENFQIKIYYDDDDNQTTNPTIKYSWELSFTFMDDSISVQEKFSSSILLIQKNSLNGLTYISK